jgi:uncharacterized membrane protein
VINVRGREVSRIEGFSDAVFGFALTLLVVSLEVPNDISGLKQILLDFLPFVVTFVLVCWIWYEHYAFFRMFDAEDALTITLNCALLFLVLFFVYPLKFVAARVVALVFGNRMAFRDLSEDDGRLLMWVYSAGFAAMMFVFVLLYWNVYRRRDRLGLTPAQAFEARAGVRTHFVSVFVGVLSVVLALALPIDFIWIAGVIYAVQGPLHWRNGVLIERERARVLPSSTPARQ